MNMTTFFEGGTVIGASLYSSNQSFDVGMTGMGNGGNTAEYTAGDNIKIENNVISVVTTDEAESDNTAPITSAGVYTQIGNINVLLGTI